MEKSFLLEEKRLRGNQEKPLERKNNLVQGKEIATGSSSRGGGDYNVGSTQCFTKPKDLWHLIPTDIEE
jgi:hypothetical protein